MVRQVSFSELSGMCPRSFAELKLGAYQKLFTHWDLDKEPHERDHFKLFAILTGQPFKVVDPTPEKEAAIYELTCWVNDPIPYSRDVPKVLTVGEKTIEIPEQVGHLSIGQNILLKQLIDKSKYYDESLSMATAIYLQPFYDGCKFDYAKAKELEKVIREMQAIDVYAIGFFLLKHAERLGSMRSKDSLHQKVSLAERCARVLARWLKFQGSQDMQTSHSLHSTR